MRASRGNQHRSRVASAPRQPHAQLRLPEARPQPRAGLTGNTAPNTPSGLSLRRRSCRELDKAHSREHVCQVHTAQTVQPWGRGVPVTSVIFNQSIKKSLSPKTRPSASTARDTHWARPFRDPRPRSHDPACVSPARHGEKMGGNHHGDVCPSPRGTHLATLGDTVPSRDQAPALLGFTETRCPVTRLPAGGRGSVVSGFQPQRGKAHPPPRECTRLLAQNVHPGT